MMFLVIIYFLLLTIFTWFKFRWAIGLFILVLPAYVVQFNIGPLPSTLLELSFGAVFLVWLIKYARSDWPGIMAMVKNNRWLFIIIGMFLLASIVAIFRAGMVSQNHVLAMTRALGHWRAYFLEPMLLFVVLLGRSRYCHSDPPAGGEESLIDRNRRDPCATTDALGGTRSATPQDDSLSANDIILFFTLSTISISIVALVQKFTGHWYPAQLWDDHFFGRVTSFFTSPNAIGLYLAPIIFLVVYMIIFRLRDVRYVLRDKLLNCYIVILFGALVAILFSFSQGAWMAIGVGVMVGIFWWGYKKFAIVVILLSMSVALFIPNIRTVILFQDKAGENRILLWQATGRYLTNSSGNFVFGTGLRKFYNGIQKPLFKAKIMEPLIYPHNIILNFWTETGLSGATTFIGLLVYLFVYSWRIISYDKILGVGLIGALAAFTVQGLVDVPYFKNDLAFLFWILVSIILVSFNQSKNFKIEN